MKQKVFTVRDAHRFWGHDYASLLGQRVQTTDQFTAYQLAPQTPLRGTITGTTTGGYEVADALKRDGFTEHEVYTITFDDGVNMVVWAEEIVPLIGEE